MRNPGSTRRRRPVGWAALTLLLAAAPLLYGCGDNPSASANAPAESASPEPPAAAPDAPASLTVIDAPQLRALIDEAAASGEVTVIDFWATWCIPCIAMFPDVHGGLDEFKQQGRAVRSVTVTLDDVGTPFEQNAIKFLGEQGALHDAYIVPPDGQQQVEFVTTLGEKWTDLVVPAILVFDAEGNLAGEFLKGPPDVPEILALVDRLSAPTP